VDDSVSVLDFFLFCLMVLSWRNLQTSVRLFLQAFLFAFLSFRFSFFFGHRFVLGASHSQFDHRIEMVGVEN